MTITKNIRGVATVLQNLNWPTLQSHRKRMCLSSLYKSVKRLFLALACIPDHILIPLNYYPK